MKKQILILICALGTLPLLEASSSSSSSSSRAVSRTQKRDAAEGIDFSKYIDLGDLFLSLGRLVKRKTVEANTVLIALIEAAAIGKLPLTVSDNRETTIDEFFEPDKLKEFLSTILNDWAKGRFEKSNFPSYLRLLKDSLLEDAIVEEFGDNEWLNITSSIDRAIEYYRGTRPGPIEDCIDFETMPALFGFLIKDLFIIPVLYDALNGALNGSVPTLATFLDCIDFKKLAIRLGNEENTLPNMEGVKHFIELCVAFVQNDMRTLDDVLEILAVAREERKARELSLALVPQRNS